MTQGLDFNHNYLQGSGALAILVMAFTAGTAWRKQGWETPNGSVLMTISLHIAWYKKTSRLPQDNQNIGWGDSNPVTETLASLWVFFQPLLFSLIGAEVDNIFQKNIKVVKEVIS